MLSGDKAYELFTSSESFPLHNFLEQWKAGTIQAKPSYVISVIRAYVSMLRFSGDSRYGIIRSE